MRATRFPHSIVRFEGQFRIIEFGSEIIGLSIWCIPDPELSSFIIFGIADMYIAGE